MVVFVCIYGRHKPGKVRKEFQQDGKLFVTGREVVLVCDESKDEIGRTVIPNHKDMPAPGKELLVQTFDVQVVEEFDGHAVLPPPPEPPAKAAPTFKAPRRMEGAGRERSHPYADVGRAVRRGGSFANDRDDAAGDNKSDLKPLVREAESEKPASKKNKYSLF